MYLNEENNTIVENTERLTVTLDVFKLFPCCLYAFNYFD